MTYILIPVVALSVLALCYQIVRWRIDFLIAAHAAATIVLLVLFTTNYLFLEIIYFDFDLFDTLLYFYCLGICCIAHVGKQIIGWPSRSEE